MKKLINILLFMVLILSVLLPTQVAIASNTTLAEYIGTVRITNNGTTASDVFTVFNLTTQDLIDGDFCWQNVTNSSMETNGSADTAYMPAPGATTAWCVYVPSIIASGVLDYKLHIGGEQDMDGDIRYFPAISGMTTLDSGTLEPGANNWTIEQSGFFNTTASSNQAFVDKDEAVIGYVSDTNELTAGVYGTTTDFQYYNAGDDNDIDINAQVGAQTFTTAQRHYFEHVRLYLDDGGFGTTGIMTVSLQATIAGVPTGVDLTSTEFDVTPLVVAKAWYQIDMDTPYPLDANTTYAIVCTDTSLTNMVRWGVDTTAPTYTGGQVYYPSPATPQAWDAMFEEWGYIYVDGTATSGERVITTSLGVFDKDAIGNTLHFDGTVNSRVDCGAIYNNQQDFWVVARFRLDADMPAGVGGSQFALFEKKGGPADFIILHFLNGELYWWNVVGGGTIYQIYLLPPEAGTPDYWAADKWYTILASNNLANGARLRLADGGTSTNPGHANLPNAGSVYLGYNSVHDAFLTGETAFTVVGTDTLLAAEETSLLTGYTPGDETDLWYMDEGTGTAITSYGSGANLGTAGAANTWETSTAPHNFLIDIDGTTYGHHIIDVPGNNNDWDFLQNGSVPFLEYQEIYVNGVQQQYIEWENDAATFTDQSGQGHDATPTFRVLSSDPDVTAELISFTPVSTASATNWTISAPSDMIGPVVEPSELFNETVDTGIPGVPFVEDVMDGAGVPSIMFYVPLVMLLLCIVGLVVGKFSLLAQLIIMSMIIFASSGVGVPAWIGLIFLLDGLAFVLASKNFGW